jgi:hypothetical protein
MDDILNEIKVSFENFLKERDDNEEEKPDVYITHKDNVFIAKVVSQKLTVNTGIGGFRLIIEAFGNLQMLKVEYNGKILNMDGKRELQDKIMSDGK